VRTGPEQTPFDEVRRAAVREYAARHAGLRAVGEEYVALVAGILDEGGINYLSVTGRTKSVTSVAPTAVRPADGRPLYADPLREITDQIGVRVITYLRSDVTAVAALLADQLDVLDDRDLGEETASEGRFGYASRHLLVGIRADTPPAEGHPALVEHVASVQIRTVLQHAWAEFEHDIRYKGTIPDEQAPDLDRRFTLAAGLLELADREFAEIRDRLQLGLGGQVSRAGGDDPRISAQQLAAFLAGHFPEAGWSRTDRYDWIAGLLLELGITSLEELDDLLDAVETATLDERMGYRYPPGAVRRLDDALLATYGDRYIGLHSNTQRTDLLRTRLARLRGPDGQPEGRPGA
jgi:ppGpp synthetase/RelA/SpoT-type nucleotidyltranferase